MQGDCTTSVDLIKALLVKNHKIYRPDTSLELTSWRTRHMPCLQQQDGYSCGILTIGNMRTAALRLPPYTLEQAEQMRTVIAREIQIQNIQS